MSQVIHVDESGQPCSPAGCCPPTPADAKARCLVWLPDGRVGRLVYAPAASRTDRTKAKVLVDGRHLHIELAELRRAL